MSKYAGLFRDMGGDPAAAKDNALLEVGTPSQKRFTLLFVDDEELSLIHI